MRDRNNLSLYDPSRSSLITLPPFDFCICVACEPAMTSAEDKCQGCKVARYCSRECQKQDWATHKLICISRRQLRQRQQRLQAAMDNVLLQTLQARESMLSPDAKAILECIQDIGVSEVVNNLDIVPVVHIIVSMPEEGSLRIWSTACDERIDRAVASSSTRIHQQFSSFRWKSPDCFALHFIAIGERHSKVVADLGGEDLRRVLVKIAKGDDPSMFNMIVRVPRVDLLNLRQICL